MRVRPILLSAVCALLALTGCTADATAPTPSAPETVATPSPDAGEFTGLPDSGSDSNTDTDAHPDTVTRRGHGTATIGFAEPTQVAHAWIACAGGVTGVLNVSVAMPDDLTDAFQAGSITCDGSPQPVATADLALASYGMIASVTAEVLIRQTPTDLVLSVTPARVDEWEGYYNDRPSEAGASMMWSSFGSPDAVGVRHTGDLTIPAGAHVVRVECAGPSSVAVTISEGEDDATLLAHVELPCGDQTHEVAVTARTPGLAFQCDSHGEAGAFRLTIDPDHAVPAP